MVPFTVVVDDREKAPYHFEGLAADANLRHRPLVVPTQIGHLASGDYSILGCERWVAIERKSAADIYSTIGRYHARFEREHERLSRLDFAAVVVEASWESLLARPPERSRVRPKTLIRTCLAWTIRYRVPWFTVEGRRAGEIVTFRLLQKWWAEMEERLGAPASSCKRCGLPLAAHRSWKRGIGPVCNAHGDRELARALEGRTQ